MRFHEDGTIFNEGDEGDSFYLSDLRGNASIRARVYRRGSDDACGHYLPGAEPKCPYKRRDWAQIWQRGFDETTAALKTALAEINDLCQRHEGIFKRYR